MLAFDLEVAQGVLVPKDMGRVDFSQRDRIYFHLDFDSGDNGSICFSSFSGVRYFFSTDSSLTSAEPTGMSGLCRLLV